MSESTGADELFQPMLVRASAGTGKTYQLTARLMRILLSGARPETVLATTFTRKAAGEILSRIFQTLGEAAVDPDEAKLQALRDQVELPGLPRRVCEDLLHDLVRNVHRLRICTLDSLFSQLARAFPYELALPAGWRLTDAIEEVWLREAAVTALIDSLRATETETLLAMLGRGDVKRNVAKEMIDVVQNTYTLARQADRQAWDQLAVPSRPESDAITSAAGHLRSTELKQKSLTAQLQLAADHMDARDFSPLIDSTLLANVAKAKRKGEPVRYGRSVFPEDVEPPLELLYSAVESECRSLLRAQNQATGTVVDAYEKSIEAIKQVQRSFAFDDIATRLAALFRSSEDRPLEDRLDASVDHLLLDEFQDTSPIQWQVLRVLAESVTRPREPATTSSSLPARTTSFFCVGDTKQAIYGWRGGVAEIFDSVADHIDGLTVRSQDRSYRSSPVVLDAVTSAFQHMHRHPLATPAESHPAARAGYEAEAIKSFADRFPVHEAAKSLPGYVEFRTGPMPAEPAGGRKPSAEELFAATLDAASDRIARLSQQSPATSIGVLTRTNRTVAEVIARLEHLGVDVSAEGGNPLDDSPAVRWVLSALMMVEHPGDGRWAYHVRHSPLCDRSGSWLPWDASDTHAATNALRDHLEVFGLADTVTRLCADLMPAVDATDRTRLQQLIHSTALFRQPSAGRLRDFVTWVRQNRVQRPRAAAVRVMTVHQAKGLEFDAVVLPELHKTLTGFSPQCVADTPDLSQPPAGMSRSVGERQWHFLPPRWQRVMGRQAASQMTEALCLLYVAMTRARQGLLVITPPVTKAEFNLKTPASLLYHAWGCQTDPTQGDQTLWESGNSSWWQTGRAAPAVQPPVPVQRVLRFQPAGSPPDRG